MCMQAHAQNCKHVLFNGIHDFSYLMVPDAYPLLCPNEGYQQGPDDHPKGICVINTESLLSCMSVIVGDVIHLVLLFFHCRY